MRDKLIRHGGVAVVAMSIAIGGKVYGDHQTASAAREFGLSAAEAELQKACVRGLDYYDETYDIATSDARVCACVARQLDVPAGMDDAATYMLERYYVAFDEPARAVADIAARRAASKLDDFLPARFEGLVDSYIDAEETCTV